MRQNDKKVTATVNVYHGYGHTHNLVVYGHVLSGNVVGERNFSANVFQNMVHLVKLFLVKPLPFVKVRLDWRNEKFFGQTAKDGFFKFEWQSATEVAAGWHAIRVHLLNAENEILETGEGKIFVPNSTQYGFISDIDDTVLVSHSATTGKKLRVMFTKNPRSRKTFADVVKFYQLLSTAHTDSEIPNPFFYVSSSEWNLYDDLNAFFKHNGLPKGAFLLNDIKRWYQLLKTGGGKHEGKLIRVTRVLNVFPKQRFVLLGDNSQRDPEIYAAVAKNYPEQIACIYIRNILPEKADAALDLMNSITNKTIHTCLFEHTDQAILHAKEIGLIG